MSADPSGFGDTSLGSGDSFNSSSAPDLGFSSPATSYPVGSPAATIASNDSTIGGYSGIGGSGGSGAVANPGVPASTGTNLSSILGGLNTAGSAIGSVLNSPLGELGLAAGEYELIAGQASAAQTQNNALADKISAIGQPELTAGRDLLSSYQSGQLTGPFQTQVDAAKAANKNAATSQQQQVAQLLANSGGGQNVQSALSSESGQIQAQQAQLDQQAMATGFQQELQASLNLTGQGGAYVQAGIAQEIASNTQLQEQLSELMGALAQAYAKSVAAGGGSAGGGNPFSAASSLLTPSNVTSAGKLLGQVGGSGASSAATTANLLGQGLGSDASLTDAAIAGSEAAPDLSVLGDAAGTDLSGAFGGESAGSAAAGAAGAGAGAAAGLTAADLGAGAAITAGTDLGISGAAADVAASLAATDTGAAVAAGAGAGAASTLGTIAAVAPYVAAVVAIGYGIYSLAKGPHTEDDITSVAPGQSVIKLQSGNSALQQGNFAVGAGSDRKQGSGQAFVVPSSATTINGEQVAAGQPYALSKFSNTLLEDYARGKIDTSQPISPNSGSNQYSDLYDVYGNNGGQATWGVDFHTWLTQIKGVYGNVSGNLWD